MKIDSHLHLNLHDYTLGNLINHLDENKIDSCWLLSWEDLNPPVPSIYTSLPIEQIMEAFNKYPERIIPFYAPYPKKNNLSAQFDKYSSLGIKGCGELKVPFKWESDEINQYLEILKQYKLPFVFHMENSRNIYFSKNRLFKKLKLEDLLNGAFNGLSKEIITKISHYIKPLQSHINKNSVFFPGYLLDFAGLEKRIEQYPHINFVGHGPHFWNNISAKVNPFKTHNTGKIKNPGIIDSLLERYDNLYCDISGISGFFGLTRDKKYAKYFLEKHYKKILFGTDNRQLGLEKLIRGFKLPDYKQKRIFGLNAQDLIDT
jgi:predicted TIM-barrel fold metal-dependent hydrolase